MYAAVLGLKIAKRKFAAIIGLYDFRSVPEKLKRPQNEVNSTLLTYVFIGINKPFSGSLVDNRILIILLTFTVPLITFKRNMLHVHLPLYAENQRCVIWFRFIRFTFRCFIHITALQISV